MEKWLVSAKRADFDGWAREFSISPVLARIIRNRDITDSDEVKRFLYGTMADCHSPWLLCGMEKAVLLIRQKIRAGEAIRVIGDYDADGICSAYILTEGLRMLGARADTAIPHRVYDGYGLNEHLLREALEDGIGTVITCDNGIAALPQIAYAKEQGMTVIVTDHHEVPFAQEEGEKREILPPADVIIDPKLNSCTYPQKNICGAVVAYKLLEALAESEKNEKLTECLDKMTEFVAIATVCDVMELKGENRIFVREGLKRLRRTQNEGLRALIAVNGLEADRLSAYHLGFVLGPCLNATGRLDTALRALELLQCRDRAQAMNAASELKALNESRKNLTVQGVEEAVRYISERGKEENRVIVVFLPEVHESLAGIIAGRIREMYHRPAFVFTKSGEGVKGSGRSIEAYHMYENLTAVQHCFSVFGGHRLAAGMTLAPRFADPLENVEAFDREVNEKCSLTWEDMMPKVHIDVPMPFSCATRSFAEELKLLEPFGMGNPQPLFAQKDLRFVRGRKMGSRLNCARYSAVTPEGLKVELVFFGDLQKFGDFLDEKYGPGSGEKIYTSAVDYKVSVTYRMNLHNFRGEETLEFVMQNYC